MCEVGKGNECVSFPYLSIQLEINTLFEGDTRMKVAAQGDEDAAAQ